MVGEGQRSHEREVRLIDDVAKSLIAGIALPEGFPLARREGSWGSGMTSPRLLKRPRVPGLEEPVCSDVGSTQICVRRLQELEAIGLERRIVIGAGVGANRDEALLLRACWPLFSGW